MNGLDSTAIITPSDIGGDLFLHLGPQKMGFQILIHSATTWMDGQLGRMSFIYNLISRFMVLRYHKSVLEP